MGHRSIETTLTYLELALTRRVRSGGSPRMKAND